MDLQSLIAKLHPLERAVLPVLKEERNIKEISKKSKLQEIEVRRAVQWMENKNIIKTHVDRKKIVSLDKNGLKYKREGLPEKSFLRSLSDEYKGINVITKKAKLNREEINACLGVLKRKVAIEIQNGEPLQVKITKQGKKLLDQQTPEEQFLAQQFPMNWEEIKDLNRYAVDELKKRKDFINIEEEKVTTIELTELGKKLVAMDLGEETINRLTIDMLKTGSWKDKKFRAYDVEVNVSAISGGKVHFDNQAIDYIKRIWLELGFKEMTGNYVQSAFWDLDSLFVPQDHPARDMQDTFYLENKAKLPELWKKIKEVHEHGGDTGSRGWGYKFSQEEAEKLLLRTHTTVLSAQTISKLKKENLPAKFFAVGKVFRNETLDWKHLFEFYQIEGIVVDPNANFQHLKGYLTEFYQKMGFAKVRMRPAHFPYTEPSVEVDVFHPLRKEWVELGGAGIFRPEVVKPLLGFECPVLAWGQGMARIISEYWKINDLRDLYKNDFKQLSRMKAWLR